MGFIQYERYEWIADDTWNFIRRRKHIKSRLNNIGGMESNTLRIEYTRLNKEVKKSARQDKRRFYEDITEQAQQATNGNNLSETYRLARKLTGKHF